MDLSAAQSSTVLGPEQHFGRQHLASSMLGQAMAQLRALVLEEMCHGAAQPHPPRADCHDVSGVFEELDRFSCFNGIAGSGWQLQIDFKCRDRLDRSGSKIIDQILSFAAALHQINRPVRNGIQCRLVLAFWTCATDEFTHVGVLNQQIELGSGKSSTANAALRQVDSIGKFS